jgi:hypothetical protein
MLSRAGSSEPEGMGKKACVSRRASSRSSLQKARLASRQRTSSESSSQPAPSKTDAFICPVLCRSTAIRRRPLRKCSSGHGAACPTPPPRATDSVSAVSGGRRSADSSTCRGNQATSVWSPFRASGRGSGRRHSWEITGCQGGAESGRADAIAPSGWTELHALLIRHQLPERSYHALRHYFLTALVRGGANLEALRELAGPSKLHHATRRARHRRGLRNAIGRLPSN